MTRIIIEGKEYGLEKILIDMDKVDTKLSARIRDLYDLHFVLCVITAILTVLVFSQYV